MTARIIKFPRALRRHPPRVGGEPCQILILPRRAIDYDRARRLAAWRALRARLEAIEADLASPIVAPLFRFDAYGNLIDGHNRLAAMRRLGVLPPGF